MTARIDTTLVIPTLGRDSLRSLLRALQKATGPRPAAIILVDDRPPDTSNAGFPLEICSDVDARDIWVMSSWGRGPSAARNRGWRAARTPWVSFLDDDVLPAPDWFERLADDLSAAGPQLAGSKGKVTVPLPTDRPPTDAERGTAGLESARWITADMTYRRAWLQKIHGFDERFPRAYREDSDIALRITEAGGRIADGSRRIEHPVRAEKAWFSVRQQRGNADDALLRRLHGPHWRQRIGAGRGRLPSYAAGTAFLATGIAGAAFGKRRIAAAGLGAWAFAAIRFAWSRIAPGPRHRDEVVRMLATSLAIPPAALWWRLRGELRHRRVRPWARRPDLVLFDRDGTLIRDVPYNGDPDLVEPMPGAREAVHMLRRHGVAVAVVSNQSAVGSGRITADDMWAVNQRVEDLLGPFDSWQICPHERDAGCECRKPEPALIWRACSELGVPLDRTVMIGDIGSDVEAADAAGTDAILVPTPATRPEEITHAHCAPDLLTAVSSLLAGAR